MSSPAFSLFFTITLILFLSPSRLSAVSGALSEAAAAAPASSSIGGGVGGSSGVGGNGGGGSTAGGPAGNPSPSNTHRLSARIVTTKYGTMRGIVTSFGTPSGQVSRHLQPVEAFLGIPYASAPMGSLRFMPPVTPSHWRGVRVADRFGPVCPQRLPEEIRWAYPSGSASAAHQASSGSANEGPEMSRINETEALKRMPAGRLASLRRLLRHLGNQSEDCLYLNIYVPFSASKEPHRLPVLVFIHGESYEWNSGNAYDGSVLASFANSVVITINYRLGVLGFLPAVDGSAKGNYGLMDQVAALHWIQENIGEFGGDPRNVTLWGHGHGAACVNILMLSPMARRLFHRAILQSGSALSPWAIARDAPANARHLAKILGCPLHDGVAAVECLRQRPVEDLLRPHSVQGMLNEQHLTPRHLTAFGPTVDGIVLPAEPLLLMNAAAGIKESPGLHPLMPQHTQNPSLAMQMMSLQQQHEPSSVTSASMRNGMRQIISSVGSEGMPQAAASSSPNSWITQGSSWFGHYDLLFGATRVESYFQFSAQEERIGIDESRRDRLLRTLVRNLFTHHLQEIFLTIVNEYTDWTKPVQHPLNILDGTSDALGDALVVAPLTLVGRLHAMAAGKIAGSSNPTPNGHSGRKPNFPSFSSGTGGNTFSYIFGHQTEEGDFSHRVGCVHGEDLAYVFGAPLLSISAGNNYLHHFYGRNYTKQEVQLSEAAMTYWGNFIRFGEPTPSTGSDSDGSSSSGQSERPKTKYDKVTWPPYDPGHQRYLSLIGNKVKVRDHYHAHRLSFWLELIPKLHATGAESALARHHLLEDHDNQYTYDGVVRHTQLFPGPSLQGSGHHLGPPYQPHSPSHHIPSSAYDPATGPPPMTRIHNFWPGGQAATHPHPSLEPPYLPAQPGQNNPHLPLDPRINMSPMPPLPADASSSPSSWSGESVSSTPTTNISDYMAVVMQHTGYSTALSVTVAVGCSLLILNILIFAGIYYQRDKEKLESKLQHHPPPGSRGFQESCSYDRDSSMELHHHHMSMGGGKGMGPSMGVVQTGGKKKLSPGAKRLHSSTRFQEISPSTPPPPPPAVVKVAGGIKATAGMANQAGPIDCRTHPTTIPECQPLLDQQQQHQQHHRGVPQRLHHPLIDKTNAAHQHHHRKTTGTLQDQSPTQEIGV